LIGFSTFLFNNEKAKALISTEELVRILLANIIQFLSRTILVAADWETACTLYSSNTNNIVSPYNKQIIRTIREIILRNTLSFGIKSLTKIIIDII